MRGALAMASLTALAACGTAGGEEDSGERGARDFQVGAFDRIELAGSPDVTVVVGGAPSVRAEGDTRRLEKLEVKVENGVLHIGQKKTKFFGWSSDRPPLTIRVTTPSLRGAEVAGSGNIRVDKVTGDDFQGAIAGSGELELGHLQAKMARFAIAGSGNVRAAGQADMAEYTIAGSGDVQAQNLEARRAKVSIAGSGNVQAKAMETADVEIMGSGDVVVSGTAKCSVSKAGSGNVSCGS
jgi:hypothetical protein